MTDLERSDRFTWEPGDLTLTGLPLESIFRTGDPPRDKFLSRVFGIFSEDVVRFWCQGPDVQYRNLGRPTLIEPSDGTRCTLDFLLEDQLTRAVFVAEMKCELEFDGYRYLRLTDAAQIVHHRSPAFTRFRELTLDPTRYVVQTPSGVVDPSGTVLIWGAVDEDGRRSAMAEYGFAAVLSVEEMLNDLRAWGSQTGWPAFVADRQRWADALFDSLVGQKI